MVPQYGRQISKFYAEARARAQRRRSPWNLILIPLVLGGWLSAWYVLFRLVWAFHQFLYPTHQFRDFWQPGISFSSFVPSFLMTFAPVPGAICLGMVAANCIAWLIPPARRTFDAESVGYPGTSFREATGALLKAASFATPFGLIIALIAASTLRSLR